MTQTWISKTAGKMFKVKQNQPGINPAVAEEFESARNPTKREGGKVLLEPKFSQNSQLN